MKAWPYLFAFFVRQYCIAGGYLSDIPKAYQITAKYIDMDKSDIDWVDTGICALVPSESDYQYRIAEASLHIMLYTFCFAYECTVYAYLCHLDVLSRVGSGNSSFKCSLGKGIHQPIK